MLLSDDRATAAEGWPPFVESAGTHVDIVARRPQLFDAIAADTRIWSWSCDLTNEQAIRACIRATEHQVGPLSGVVHSPSTRASAAPEAWERTFARSRRNGRVTEALRAAVSDRQLEFFVCLAADGETGDVSRDWLQFLASAHVEAVLENADRGVPRLVVRISGNYEPIVQETPWDRHQTDRPWRSTIACGTRWRRRSRPEHQQRRFREVGTWAIRRARPRTSWQPMSVSGGRWSRGERDVRLRRTGPDRGHMV